jgi:threonine dehydrogenase-like Zn-dependent dehydrogenase
MKAVCWFGRHAVRVEDVPDPTIIGPRDAIIKVSLTAICGSDVHLYGGYIPGMREGDILGHEFMGEIAEVGGKCRGLKVGDRVVVPFAIACGSCFFCKSTLYALCDNSNPNAALAAKLYGFSPAGLFGSSHLFGGYAGGQAEYVRVPYADVGAFKVPDDVSDEQALFLADILPTGYMAAENGDIQRGDTVAVWGAGPVGQLAVKSAYLLGAERVIAIDRYDERLRMTKELWGAQIINYEKSGDVFELLKDITHGRGPDVCIDAVGMEAHGTTIDELYDRMKHAVRLETDRPHALRQTIHACRKAGTVSIPGSYGGFLDRVPLGAAFAKGLTLKMGPTHVHRYMWPLCQRIQRGEIDPASLITHRMRLADAPRAYEMLRDRPEQCVKVVLRP